jgi:hypothetical protein
MRWLARGEGRNDNKHAAPAEVRRLARGRMRPAAPGWSMITLEISA